MSNPQPVPPAGVDVRGEVRERIAKAILNARGARRGMPAINNIEALVGPKLWAEALDDADAVHAALLAAPPPSAPATHSYQPDPKYPWFCRECGYSRDEVLKHGPAALPASPTAASDGGETP